jgi:hypothetical protein
MNRYSTDKEEKALQIFQDVVCTLLAIAFIALTAAYVMW